MNVQDLLDPIKMKAFEDRFRVPTPEDYEDARKKMAQAGFRPPMPYIKSPKLSAMFKRSNFGKSNAL